MSTPETAKPPELRSLSQIQRWMQAVIMHPDGVHEGIQAAGAQQVISISPDQLNQVVLPSRKLSSERRLEVYANAYYARLLECLREEFAATAHFLSAETFDAFAFAYLQSYPSQSYTLADLGASFPNYLYETRSSDESEAAGHPESHPSWPEFLVDLAELERIYSEVFMGPGVESRRLCSADDISGLNPDELLLQRLVPVPCLRLVEFRFPVHEYISQFRGGLATQIPEAAPTYLVITRKDYIVHRTAVDRQEFRLLASLVKGATIGEAIEELITTCALDEESVLQPLHEWFRHWSISGYFLGFSS